MVHIYIYVYAVHMVKIDLYGVYGLYGCSYHFLSEGSWNRGLGVPLKGAGVPLKGPRFRHRYR